jgi:hypothetical protein
MSPASNNGGGAARRRFFSGLLLAVAQAALLGSRSRAASAAELAAAANAALEKTLAGFLDTILPADALSGSASDLGLPKRILGEAAGDELYSRLIAVGCQWLDRAAEGSFASSNPRVHHVIVTWMAESDYNEVPRRFYELLRQRAVELYYSAPEAWGGLAISRPPQPIGYPDHWQ